MFVSSEVAVQIVQEHWELDCVGAHALTSYDDCIFRIELANAHNYANESKCLLLKIFNTRDSARPGFLEVRWEPPDMSCGGHSHLTSRHHLPHACFQAQAAVMKHALDAGVPVNADIWPRKSLEGGLLRIPVGPEGSLCGVRLLTFLDGALFKSVPQVSKRAGGQLLATR